MFDTVDIGMPRPAVRFPHNARVCFTVGVAFEGFLKACQYRHRTTPLDKPDLFSLSYAEYGLKVGVWRLLDIFSEAGVRASFSVSGLAAHRFPKTLKAISDRGHEIVGHAWSNDGSANATDDIDIERAEVNRTLDAIVAATGLRPIGWVSPGSTGSEARSKVLIEESGILWTGDDASEDLPYVVKLYGRDHAILPRTNFGSNDLIVYLLAKNTPADFFDSFKAQFDELYREGSRGSPKWMDLVIHAHVSGRPMLAPVIRQCIEYAMGHEGVWQATKGDLACWFLESEERSL
jgi:peptidoglycan/xylan/chitin deacetylase (PgdA/CDA1 family)